MEKPKKFYNISLLRIFAIFMIFSFHLCQTYSLTQGKQYFPLYFGVQIFLFISGFLYSFKEISSYKVFFKKNFTKILVPTFLFISICLVVGGLYALFTQTGFVDFFYRTSASGEVMSIYGHLWYIPAILFCYLTLPLLKNLDNKKVLYIPLSLLFVVEIVLMTFLNVQMVFLPFYAGFVFYKILNTAWYQKNKIWLLIVCVAIFVGAGMVHYFAYNSAYMINKLPYLRSLLNEASTGLLGISFSVLFIETFSFANKFDRLSKPLGYTDKYIFALYFMHSFMIIALTLNGGIPVISGYLAVNIILIMISTLVSTIIFQKVADVIIKHLPWMKKK